MPQATYERLRHRADQGQRSIEDEALQTLDAGRADEPPLPADLIAALATMALLDDKSLRWALRLRLSSAAAALFAAHSDKEQRVGLTEAERQVVTESAARHGRIVALRAEAE